MNVNKIYTGSYKIYGSTIPWENHENYIFTNGNPYCMNTVKYGIGTTGCPIIFYFLITRLRAVNLKIRDVTDGLLVAQICDRSIISHKKFGIC